MQAHCGISELLSHATKSYNSLPGMAGMPLAFVCTALFLIINFIFIRKYK